MQGCQSPGSARPGGPSDIVVHATVRRINPSTQAELIAAYEEVAPKHPTEEKIARRLHTVQEETKPQIALHRRMLTDGV